MDTAKPVQFSKALSPILSTDDPRLSPVMPVQSLNAWLPICTTLLGIVTVSPNPVHPLKADAPICSKALYMVRVVKFVQPWKADAPTVVTAVPRRKLPIKLEQL